MSTQPRPPAGPRRTLLGAERGVLSNARVYRTADALEVDLLEGYDVTRRSVLLDEVLLVTYHRAYGWRLLVGSAVVVTLVSAISGLIALQSPQAGGAVFAILALPFAIAAALRLALRLDVVTVYGIRSQASMSFWFRKRHAREVFALVCRLVRERQPPPRPAARSVMPATPPPAPPPLEPPGPGPEPSDSEPSAG